jgi:competence protein ComEA
MNDDTGRVDINLASIEELVSVPGIGPSLAERIDVARPFDSIDDLTRVSGIGPMLLDRLRPYLSGDSPEPMVFEGSFSSPLGEDSEEQPVEQAEEEFIEATYIEETEPTQSDQSLAAETLSFEEPEGEPLPDILRDEPTPVKTTEQPNEDQTVVQSTARATPKAQVKDTSTKTLERGEVIWIGVALAILVLALSLVFNLGTLSMVNGTLNYASASEVRELNARAEALATRVQVLEGDIEILQGRMNTFEALSGRITTLERNNENLRSDLATATGELETLREQSNEYSSQIKELENRNNVFQNFLDGLRRLLNVQGTP